MNKALICLLLFFLIPLSRASEVSYFSLLRDSLDFYDVRVGDVKWESDSSLHSFKPQNTYWFKISDIDEAAVSMLFDRLDRLSFYLFEGDSLLDSLSQGYIFADAGKNMVSTAHIYHSSFLKQIPEAELLVKIQSRYPVPYFGFTISSYEEGLSASYSLDSIVFIYAGAVIIMILYNLFLYFSLSDKVYLYYSLAAFFIMCIQLSLKGIFYVHIMPGATMNAYMFEASAGLGGLFLVVFVREFLKSWNYTPKLDSYYKFMGFCVFFWMLFSWIISYDIGILLLIVFSGVIGLFSVIFIYLNYVRYNRKARYMLFAQIVFFIAVIWAVLADLGFFSRTEFLLELGSGLELLLFSLALADRINFLQKEKRESDIRIREILENQNQLLEAEVASKTEDLHQVNNELKTRMLSAQMNPHFIFNVLNSIQSFVLNEKREEAGKYMAKFSRLMRFYLTGSLKRFISLKDELEALERYLELEMLRYTGGFNYKLEVDEKLPVDNMEVPGMLVMPFLENAIWHGVMEHKKGGLIEVFFVRKGEGCEVTIRDNGIGIEESKKRKQNEVDHESVGMKITEERLKLIHQELKTAYKFEVKQISSPDTGTKVSFTMPYKMKKT